MPLRKAILFHSRTSPVSNTCSSEYTSGGSPSFSNGVDVGGGGGGSPLFFMGLVSPPPPPPASSLSQYLDLALYTVIIILFCPTEVFDLVYSSATFTFNCVDICSGLKYSVWNLGIFISIYKALSVLPSPF